MKRARLLAFVITAAMATTVFLGGTVARYQTSANIDDTATVAKWGVKLTMAGDLYGYNYNDEANGDKPTNVTAVGNSDSISVEAKDETAINSRDQVAPGTVGDTLKISLTGETEVDVEITYTIDQQDIYLKQGKYAIMQKITVENVTEYEAMVNKSMLYRFNGGSFILLGDTDLGESNFTSYKNVLYVKQNEATASNPSYSPVKYKLTYDERDVDGNVTTDDKVAVTDVNIAEVKSWLTTMLNAGTAVEANVDLAKKLQLDDVKITWSWAIESGSGADEIKNNSNLDTILGTLMNNDTTGSTYVVQIDGATITTIGVESATGLVKTNGGAGDEIGSVKTSFSITITVSQDD